MDNLDYLEQVRGALDASAIAVPLQSKQDVEAHFPPPEAGTSLTPYLAAELGTLLYADSHSGFTSYELRRGARIFRLERALGINQTRHDLALDKIAHYVQTGKQLTSPTDPKWQRIALLGRALSLLEPFEWVTNREVNVGKAVTKLVGLGYELHLKDGRIDWESPGIARATADIKVGLAKTGLVQAMALLFDIAGRVTTFEFDQYLFGYTHAPAGSVRDPSVPCAFLLNLVAQLPDTPAQPDAATTWNQVAPLAVDLVAALDVETYDSFGYMGLPPSRFPRVLGDIGLHDHLFGMRQWPRMLTPHVLHHVFADDDNAAMLKKFGWTVRDAASFSFAVVMACTDKGASRVTKKTITPSGMPSAKVDKLLHWFAYQPGQINQGYDSPIMARKADLMFKPLIALSDGTYLVPAASVAGPAFYEALRAAVQNAIGSVRTNHLVGTGTERVAAELFRRRNIQPTRENKTYPALSGSEPWECDLVLEDGAHIVFVECKAKAPTRAAMSGEMVDGLVDYAGSTLKSQAQALRHERVLIDQGHIEFSDGYRLELKGRAVTRMSVTLLDHGSLQDRFLFSEFAYPVLSSKIGYDEHHPRAGTYEGVNEDIALFADELTKANERGRDVWNSTMNAVSLSVGQLAVFLNDSPTLADLVKRVRRHTSFGTANSLLEYHHAKTRGFFKANP